MPRGPKEYWYAAGEDCFSQPPTRRCIAGQHYTKYGASELLSKVLVVDNLHQDPGHLPSDLSALSMPTFLTILEVDKP